jgi:hypothetical protein
MTGHNPLCLILAVFGLPVSSSAVANLRRVGVQEPAGCVFSLKACFQREAGYYSRAVQVAEPGRSSSD